MFKWLKIEKKWNWSQTYPVIDLDMSDFKNAKAAIRQIREKGYADAYKADRRPVTLIGINFSAKKRNIDEPLLERL